MSTATKWSRKKKPSASSLTCEFCSKICSSTQRLKIHRNSHTGQKPYKCNLCDFSATKKTTLTCHMRRHTGETPYKCSFSGCGYKATTNSSIKNHFAQIHSDLKPFECSLCPFKAKLNTHLNQHVKNWHGEKSLTAAPSNFKPFPCDACDQKYTSKGNLKRHQQKRHPTAKQPEKEPQIFLCNLCQSELKSTSALVNHVNSKHTMEKRFVCEFPSCEYSAVSKPKLTSHQLHIHNVRKEGAELYKYKCGECDYQSKTKDMLKIHLVVHKIDRDFPCAFENCELAFKTKRVLENHVKIVHEMTEKPFKCAICPFSTKTNRELKLHHRGVHSTAEEKSALMLSCPFSDCQHKTLQPSNLKTHIKSHTNEKLYECNICPRKFLHKSTLTKHKMVHDDIKDFACTLCPYRGSSSGALKDHIRGHTKEKPFLCDQSSCAASFRKISYLKDHLATKHGQMAKEYKCTTEGCTAPPFAAYFQLNYHMKLDHGPLKMYKCSQPDCDFESKWEVNTKRHEKTVHNPEEDISCSSCGIFKTGNKACLKRHQDYYCANRKKFKCVRCRGKFAGDSLEKLTKHKMDVHGIRRQASINMNLLNEAKNKQEGCKK